MPPEWFERYKFAFLATLLAAVLALQLFQVMGGRRGAPAYVATPPAPEGPPKVYVSGAVARPGVYEFSPGDRLDRAIELAGGALAEADLQSVNLASLLLDEQHIHVPSIAERTVAKMKVDVNHADVKDLQELPGIGQVSAEKIVAFRRLNGPIKGPDDLLAAGLTPSQVEDIRELVLYR